ncbi:hypothetical protein DNTS_002156 [Danionella cerebrum]|uniref:Sushi domain-containing protein n=1 Tax=Danionella cerebrum TaxID=2873325 RepID=A0A553R1E2_9TELE|nr:hypothetical protein DNTS_002156 [Danionella translucida]
MTPVVPLESCSSLLAEFDCLDPLLSALRLDSGRIKCTCLSVSRKWLALGTSAGGLHLIQRDGWKQKLILTHKEGSITHASCCPHDEDFIAVATSQGLVVVWELHLERRGRPERASVSWEHRGQGITSLCWDTTTLRVFAGDTGGKVSCVRAGSSKHGKGSAFVIFPVQTITTVDSRVVQLGYTEGHLVVSSLTRCYLCDTEREKFWRVGNKERDGEFGACFLSAGQRNPSVTLPPPSPPLLYCARPGSRIWEASLNGEVLSTHQFKQLLACPPLPLVSYKREPRFNPAQMSPQSLAFTKLLQFGDQNLLTWTDSAIYIFTPHSGQVLLWTEIKDVVEISVFRNELFCLHGDGHLSHLSLVSPERCVERLMKKEHWPVAATVCCIFQSNIATPRARKSLPIDRLEQLKAQLSSNSHQQLIGQLEEIISKLEPLDSACSSRRSSISSHESFNVLDCGIYRVISRRGSQSDDDTLSLANQSMLEEERLQEFSFTEEEQVDNDSQYVRGESDRSDIGLQFLPLPFRSKPPRVALQAVRDSVSSFMKKTTEKINTLQMNTDLWPRPDLREGVQSETSATSSPVPEEVEHELNSELSSIESELQELKAATKKAISQIQDPMVLLDPSCLCAVLQEWAPVLERVLGPEDQTIPIAMTNQEHKNSEEEELVSSLSCCVVVQSEVPLSTDLEESPKTLGSESLPCSIAPVRAPFPPLPNHIELIQLFSPKPLPPDLQNDLSQLVCLYIEMGCPGRGGIESICVFLRRYFFLLDQERMRKMCVLRYRENRDVLKAFIAGMLGRLYEKHGEVAVRSYPQFYPTILPSDIMAMALPSHFLPYLDNLVQSRAEQQRLAFLGSLLQPEKLRQDWLELALAHDAPQREDTLTNDGQPRYWIGYLYLCRELERREEAFDAICRLDDMTLLEGDDGIVPQSLDEWILLLQLSQQISSSAEATFIKKNNGSCSEDETSDSSPDQSDVSHDWSIRISPENIVLRLGRVFGPDRALLALQERGIQETFSSVILSAIVFFCLPPSAASHFPPPNATVYLGSGFLQEALRRARELTDAAYAQTNERMKALVSEGSVRPNDLLALFKQTGPKTRAHIRSAEFLDNTVELIREMVYTHSMDKPGLNELLSAEDMETILQVTGCSAEMLKPVCKSDCLSRRYRTITGHCNNRENPHWGAANTPYARWLSAEYEDARGAPRGWNPKNLYHNHSLPAVRGVSQQVLYTGNEQITLDDSVSRLLVEWGQWIDHDLTLTPQSPSSTAFRTREDCARSCSRHTPCFPIQIPLSDPRSGYQSCMAFFRSAPSCVSPLGRREQLNAITAFVDASMVYGSSEVLASSLRNLSSPLGLLSVNQIHSDQGLEFMPFLPRTQPHLDPCGPRERNRPAQKLETLQELNMTKENRSFCFQAGDSRANEHLGMIALHTLFLREHNRLAEELHRINPHWSPDTLYQEARKLMGAVHQILTWDHYLPHILGESANLMPPYTGYDPSIDPSISNIFSTAAFRFAHVTIHPVVDRLGPDYQLSPAHPPLPLHHSLFASWRVVKEGGIDPVMRGLLVSPAKLQTADQMMVEELTERLFQAQGGLPLDLAALNLQRGRDHGLPGYSTWRELCGLSAPVNQSDLAGILGDVVLARKLLDLYGTPQNIDVWVGAISEPASPGGRVGPLLACLIARQFRALRDGDRFWWQSEGVFTSAQRDALRSISLSRIICENTHLQRVPLDPFTHTLHTEELLPCSNFTPMNLTAWTEPDTDPVCGAVPRLTLGFSVLCESAVLYQCPAGFLLQGASVITCHTETGQWKPQPPTCRDIDECSLNPEVCPAHLQCINTPGGHTCTGETPPLSTSSIVASVMSVLGGVALIMLLLICYQRVFLHKAEPLKPECCHRRD